MKKSHLFGLIVIAIAIAVVVSTAADSSTYGSFSTAKALQSNGEDEIINIVGELKKDEDGQIVGITPSDDKLSFSFILVDENKFEQKVHYMEPMPTDFVKSEKVVVKGKYKNDHFIADQILLKCPSKYEEDKISMNN